MTRLHPPSALSIAAATTPHDIATFQALCRQYAASLPGIGLSLEHQGFEQEMSTLPGKYASPAGAILLARLGDDWIGCVAVRPLDEPGVCEMKRMYVRPAARGLGAGHALAQAVVDHARRVGYQAMRLDTDRNMVAAIAIYTRLGFKPRERYNADPCPCTLWFELTL